MLFKKRVTILVVLVATYLLNGCSIGLSSEYLSNMFNNKSTPVLEKSTFNKGVQSNKSIIVFTMSKDLFKACIYPYSRTDLRKIVFVRQVQETFRSNDSDNLSKDISSKHNKLIFIRGGVENSLGLYAVAVQPGTYSLFQTRIQAESSNAKGNKKIFDIIEWQKSFIKKGKPTAYFNAKAGEMVYIGDMGVNCKVIPAKFKRLFLYPDEMRSSIIRIGKRNYPFLNWSNLKYRLIKITDTKFGEDFNPMCKNDICDYTSKDD